MDETLTADTSGISDADGLTNVSYSYQWIRNDGTNDADIGGQTGSTYTLVSADEGKTIKVRVSFTDDAGNEETLTSAATAAVAARPNTSATGLPTISGTAQVGKTLTANISGMADSDGLDNAEFSYQWLANDADIQNATDSTYTLTDDDVGKTIKVRVSFTDDRSNRRDADQCGDRYRCCETRLSGYGRATPRPRRHRRRYGREHGNRRDRGGHRGGLVQGQPAGLRDLPD